jgi:hypothetical protein
MWDSRTFFWNPDVAKRLAMPSGLDDKFLKDLKELRDQTENDVARLENATASLPGVGFVWKADWWGESRFSWVYPALGILFSALLAALGAPFWYDLLGRVSRRGAAGPKPDGG